jgi:4-hydroxy-2-oxoheptanedioate aldolase
VIQCTHYSDKDKSQYFSESNKKMVIVHIEGNEGINNLDAIIHVEGIDVFFLGPYDIKKCLKMLLT